MYHIRVQLISSFLFAFTGNFSFWLNLVCTFGGKGCQENQGLHMRTETEV